MREDCYSRDSFDWTTWHEGSPSVTNLQMTFLLRLFWTSWREKVFPSTLKKCRRRTKRLLWGRRWQRSASIWWSCCLLSIWGQCSTAVSSRSSPGCKEPVSSASCAGLKLFSAEFGRCPSRGCPKVKSGKRWKVTALSETKSNFQFKKT